MAAIGYLWAVLASIGYGVYTMPIKLFETYDGLIYQWYMCSGILVSGIIVGAMTNSWSTWAAQGFFVSEFGFMGGASWVLANTLITPAVKISGNIGILLANGFNVYIAFFFGLLGLGNVLRPAPPSNIPIAIVGLAVTGLANLCLLFLEPPPKKNDSLQEKLMEAGARTGDETQRRSLETTSLSTGGPDLGDPFAGERTIRISDTFMAFTGDDAPFTGVIEFVTTNEDRKTEWQAKALGIGLCLVCGALWGIQLLPYQVWQCCAYGQCVDPSATCIRDSASCSWDGGPMWENDGSCGANTAEAGCKAATRENGALKCRWNVPPALPENVSCDDFDKMKICTLREAGDDAAEAQCNAMLRASRCEASKAPLCQWDPKCAAYEAASLCMQSHCQDVRGCSWGILTYDAAGTPVRRGLSCDSIFSEGECTSHYDFGGAVTTGASREPRRCIWREGHPGNGALDFVFSQFLGIYACSTLIFLCKTYCTNPKNVARGKKMKTPSIRPAFLSGVIWGISFITLLLSVDELTATLAYPIASVGTNVVAAMLSYFYYKEVTGKKNVALFLTGMALNLVGIVMIAVAG